MAKIYRATLSPSKLELVQAWLPGRPWAGSTEGLRTLGAYRFDDPAGEVGLEGLVLATADGLVLHVPVTYRAASLAGAEEYLVGTTEHSVLGTRWVYDAAGDPVWAAALAEVVLAGGRQAEELVEGDDGPAAREPTAVVTGGGTPGSPFPRPSAVTTEDHGAHTLIRTGGPDLVVVRVAGTAPELAHPLVGRWSGETRTVLAGA